MFAKTLTKPGSIEAVFDDFLEPWNDWTGESYVNKALTSPKVNISEDDENFYLNVGAPGLHKKDFQINVEVNMLTISAEQEKDKETNDETYHRREYNYSSFTRSFTLPDTVAKEKIEASYDGGVLKLILPKDRSETGKRAENNITVK